MHNIKDRNLIDPRFLPSSYWQNDGAFGSPGYRFSHGDAAETAFIEHSAHYLYQEAGQQIRPARFRDFIKIDRSIPAAVKKYDLRKNEGFAEAPALFNDMGGVTQARPRTQRSEVSKSNFEFITGYHTFYREIERARIFNQPIDTLEIDALMVATEKFLDGIAVLGDAGVTGLSVGLTGIANLPDVAQATGGAGVDWTTATVSNMVDDLMALYNSVTNGSKETSECTHILIPLLQMQELAKQRDSFGNTALELWSKAMAALGKRAPTIQAWQKLETADGAGAPRAIAYDANDPLGPRMLISQELQNFGPPRLISGGYYQDMTVVTGGVICPKATACVYLDTIG